MATSALRPNIKTNKQTTAHKQLEPLSLGYKHFFSAHYNPASTYPPSFILGHSPIFPCHSSAVDPQTYKSFQKARLKAQKKKKRQLMTEPRYQTSLPSHGRPTGERAGACWTNVIFGVHAGAGGWRGLVCGLVHSLPPLSAGVCTFPAPRGRPWIRLPCVHG